MTRRRATLGIVAMAALVAAVALAVRPSADGRVNLTVTPDPIFTTLPFAVGETYTLGSTHVPADVDRPVRVTGITVIQLRGLEVVGTAAYEPNPDAIGLVAGWPAPEVEPVDPAEGRAWSGDVGTLVGLRILSSVAALRGVEVAWVDANGTAGTTVFDIAVVTCAPGACGSDQQSHQILRDLDLLE